MTVFPEHQPTGVASKINGKLINFIAKFDMYEISTDLALEVIDYDPSAVPERQLRVLLGCSLRRRR